MSKVKTKPTKKTQGRQAIFIDVANHPDISTALAKLRLTYGTDSQTIRVLVREALSARGK
jgi:hypothetical protein